MSRVKYNGRQQAAEQAILLELAYYAKKVGFHSVTTDIVVSHGKIHVCYTDTKMGICLQEMNDCEESGCVSFIIKITSLNTGRDVTNSFSQLLMSMIHRVGIFMDHKTYNVIDPAHMAEVCVVLYIEPYMKSLFAVMEGFRTTRFQDQHSGDLLEWKNGIIKYAKELGFSIVKDEHAPLGDKIDPTTYVHIDIGHIIFSIKVFASTMTDDDHIPIEECDMSIYIMTNVFEHKQHVEGIDWRRHYIIGDTVTIIPSYDPYLIKLYLCELFAWASGMVMSISLLKDLADGTQ